MLALAALIWVTGGIVAAFSGFTTESAGVWGIFGLAVGALVGVAHEIERGVIHSVDSLERASKQRLSSATPQVSPRALRSLSPDMRTPLGAAVYQPASDYAVSLRHMLSTWGDAQVVAVLGATPHDGATTTAASAAAIASQHGRNVLLVDCDLSRRGVTRLLDAEPEAGVLEATADPANWARLLSQEPETGLHIMPAARLANPWKRLFDQPGLAELVQQWRERYDLIILDCPPSSASAEGAMLTRLADRCVLLASWDDTPGADLRQMMRRLRHSAPDEMNLHLNRAPSDILDQVRDETL